MKFDDAASLAFVLSQRAIVEAGVYQIVYPEVVYPGLVPVDTSGDEWADLKVSFGADFAGPGADWFEANGDDVNLVEVSRLMNQSPIYMIAQGYSWNIQEIAQAQKLGINLTDEKANAARFFVERKIDQVVMYGDAVKGLTGLTNQPGVTVSAATTAWVNAAGTALAATPAQILADFNSVLAGVSTQSLYQETVNTVLLPLSVYALLASTLVTNSSGDYQGMTVLDLLTRSNMYTALTGQALTIRAVRGLESAGAGGVGRAVFYRNDPNVLKFNMPMPFRFLDNMRVGPLKYQVPGIARFGGVDLKMPAAMRYLDNVNPA